MASDGQEFSNSSDNLLPDSSNDQLWRTQELRQKARGQIEEALQQSKNPTNKSPVEMETHVFNKAQTKEEYLQFIARLIIHFREFNKNAQKQQAQSSAAMLDQMQSNVGTMGNLSSSQTTGNAQDPMSALHTLAQRGGGVSGPITSMAAAMPQQVMVGVQGVQPQSSMSMQGQSLQNMVIHGQQQIPVQTQSQPGTMNTIQQQQQQQQHQFIGSMSQPQVDHVITSLPNQQPSMNTLQGHQLQGQVSHSTMSMQGPPSVVPMQSQPQPNIYPTPRAVMTTLNSQQRKQFHDMRNHMLTRVRGQVQGVAMMPPGQVMQMQRAQIPAQRGPPPEQYQLSPQQILQQQMAPPGSGPNVTQGVFSSTISPAGLTSHSPASGPQSLQPPSMGSQMIPSPSPNIGPTPSPGAGAALSPASGIGRPVSSPSAAMLNTPLSGAQSASPAPPSAEEQAYWDKLQQLSKYIEPLQELIAQSEKGDGKEGKRDQSKLKSLLGLLTNPKRRTQLHVLIQCEQVLEKMDLLRDQSQSQQQQSQPQPQLLQQHSQQQPQQHHTAQFPILMMKQDRLHEQNIFQPLLDTLHTHLNKPMLNHTLQRTFGPSLAALCGSPIRAPSPPVKRQRTSSDEEEENEEIPDILQGEVAQLDERFRVNLDNLHHHQSSTVHLVCKLQSSQLPAVPPIGIVVPGNYPDASPQCEIRSQDYESTPFLKAVGKSLQKQLSKMPHKYSITAILNAWEMSIRQACNPARLDVSG